MDYYVLKQIEDESIKFTWCNVRPNGVVMKKFDRVILEILNG